MVGVNYGSDCNNNKKRAGVLNVKCWVAASFASAHTYRDWRIRITDVCMYVRVEWSEAELTTDF